MEAIIGLFIVIAGGFFGYRLYEKIKFNSEMKEIDNKNKKASKALEEINNIDKETKKNVKKIKENNTGIVDAINNFLRNRKS